MQEIRNDYILSLSVGFELLESCCLKRDGRQYAESGELGIDVIRIDAVPYIWKQLGHKLQESAQVHSIVRIMRIICEIVCPGVLLERW